MNKLVNELVMARSSAETEITLGFPQVLRPGLPGVFGSRDDLRTIINFHSVKFRKTLRLNKNNALS